MMGQILLVPDGTGALHDIDTLVGTVRQKLSAMLTSTSDMSIEVSDEEYNLLRPILLATDVDFVVVIDVPEIPTPRSFLLEELSERVLSFSKLEPSSEDQSPTLASLLSKEKLDSDATIS